MATTIPHPLQSSTNGHDFAEKLGELRDLLADIARAAPGAASETFEELKNKAAAVCESCEHGLSDAGQRVVKTVKDHPAQVALAAVGAGLLAWWLLSRRGQSTTTTE